MNTNHKYANLRERLEQRHKSKFVPDRAQDRPTKESILQFVKVILSTYRKLHRWYYSCTGYSQESATKI